jgi:hypothetical protein
MGFNHTVPASGKSAMRPENRVWGFSRNGCNLSLGSRRQRPEPRRKSRPTPTNFAPGIPQWPSRDPLEEGWDTDELNLYAFILNEAVGALDYLGLGRQDGKPPPANRPHPFQPPRIDQIPIRPFRMPTPTLPTGGGPYDTGDTGGTRRLPAIVQGPPFVKGPIVTPRTGSPWIDEPWIPHNPLMPLPPRGSGSGIITPSTVGGGIAFINDWLEFFKGIDRLNSLAGDMLVRAKWVDVGKATKVPAGFTGCGCLILDIAEYMSTPGDIKHAPSGYPTGIAAMDISFFAKPCKDVVYQRKEWAFEYPFDIARNVIRQDIQVP